ncbi:MAG: DEAD/DEAH box helicase family protein [Desulfococcaceae bacterium]
MKFLFEDNLDYQRAAVDAVVDLFGDREAFGGEAAPSGTLEAVWPAAARGTVFGEGAPGGAFRDFDPMATRNLTDDGAVGNRLPISEAALLENLRDVQRRNGLPRSESLGGRDFTVEMETGTGKTYVYLRTLFELNRRCGLAKFIVVVPSVAIKEGVSKTLEITRDHFAARYPAARGMEWFLHDSRKPGQIRNFAASPAVQIMIVTAAAINKRDVNALYKENEKTGGERPLDLIRAVRPVLVVDEPQSVDGGLSGRGKRALEEMNPLFTLRYSATHRDPHAMVYRLDAVDAYRRGLVKQIEVAALEREADDNRPHIRLERVRQNRGAVIARATLDVAVGAGIRRRVVTLISGDDLAEKTGRRMYADHRVGVITGGTDASLEIRHPEGDVFLRPGEEFGGAGAEAVQRLMIRRTIREHLEREKAFAERGLAISVLSLFFIDSVRFYRDRDERGNPVPGKYARMFEAEFRALAERPDYRPWAEKILDGGEIAEIHNGYFSIDKRGNWTESAETSQIHRENAERAYRRIIKEKEKLLSPDNRLKFIFSHSALREGWDNPNVFQICALREMGTERERRQTIGRGLRLCVDHRGRRLRDPAINILTVVANERYEDFARNLQREIEADTGIRFGALPKDHFAEWLKSGGEEAGAAASETLWNFLREAKYIDDAGRIGSRLRAALDKDRLALPERFENRREAIIAALRKIAGPFRVRNADRRTEEKPDGVAADDAAFRRLWTRLSDKTRCRIDFDSQRLIDEAARALGEAPPVRPIRARFRKAVLQLESGGAKTRSIRTEAEAAEMAEAPADMPDLLTELARRTGLTRRSIAAILKKSGRLSDFPLNPRAFIERAAAAVARARRSALGTGIRYRSAADGGFVRERLKPGEIEGSKGLSGERHPGVFSGEEALASIAETEAMGNPGPVGFQGKPPARFVIPTPLGPFHPAWCRARHGDAGEIVDFLAQAPARKSD